MSREAYSYEDVIKDLSSFLKESGITTIIFHQFDFLIMYFPIYMVINDLKKNQGENADCNLKIRFESKESDEAIIDGMKATGFESFDIDNNTLHIGLCEPTVFPKSDHDKEVYDDYEVLAAFIETEENNGEKYNLPRNICVKKNNGSEKSYFMHLPFINFPPIYGVSLINRDIINKIKRKKRKEGVKKGNNEDEKELSIMNYWRHFSAKLSLLDEKKDFDKLVASSYPKGSTADWFIREKIKFPLRGITWVESLEKEFDDLFNGLVDVAFTVQPWVAISKSEFHDPPLDIDIVYKNVCTEFNCTSLIFRTTKKEKLLLADYILNCFNILLRVKISELYEMNTDSLQEEIISYCRLLSEHCSNQGHNFTANNNSCNCCETDSRCSNLNGDAKEIKMEEGCLFENKMALRLTKDSQIYKHLRWVEKGEMKIEKIVGHYFVEKFGGSKEGIDKFCDGLCCHASEVRNG